MKFLADAFFDFFFSILVLGLPHHFQNIGCIAALQAICMKALFSKPFCHIDAHKSSVTAEQYHFLPGNFIHMLPNRFFRDANRSFYGSICDSILSPNINQLILLRRKVPHLFHGDLYLFQFCIFIHHSLFLFSHHICFAFFQQIFLSRKSFLHYDVSFSFHTANYYNRKTTEFQSPYSVVYGNIFCCLQKRILLFAETICTALTVPLTEQHLSLHPNCPVHTVQ